MRINCLQITASLNVDSGGPSRSVSSLCDALESNGVQVYLVYQRGRNQQGNDVVLPTNKDVIQKYVNSYKFLRGTFSICYDRLLKIIVNNANIDLVHSHGLWLQCNRAAASFAAVHNVPHVISPRGMLDPWSFKNRYWKKMPFWYLWQKRALSQASLLCATSDKEADGIRSLGFRQPIAIVPNGVEFPEIANDLILSDSVDKTALFLSRIHPVKGLFDLVHAWNKVRPMGWRCIIAGPDEEGFEARVKQMVKDLALQDSFTFVGAVYGEQKAKLFRSADLFVLPTQSENFGIAIAEALSYQVPVITTKGAPWSSIQEHQCGWWVGLGVDPLEHALREACALPRETLQQMGQRGRQLVEKEFSWQGIGMSMKSVYEWVLHGGAPPACVRLD